jgi:hypothetical protein
MKPSLYGSFVVLAPFPLAIVLGSLSLVACSSDSANPGPTVFDSGADVARMTVPDSTTAHPDAKVDTGTTKSVDGYVAPPVDAGMDALPFIEAGLPDVGACTSDAATCNSCYTQAQNPLNACAASTVNCVPFDNTRVPAGAP